MIWLVVRVEFIYKNKKLYHDFALLDLPFFAHEINVKFPSKFDGKIALMVFNNLKTTILIILIIINCGYLSYILLTTLTL